MEASPLLISADIAALPPAALEALKNPHMIAIDQSGQQCSTVIMNENIEALMKPDPQGGTAVLFVNIGPETSTGSFSLSQFGITSERAAGHNVWTGVTTSLSGVSVTLEAGQTSLLQVKQA
jgi:hypothetical protein